MPAARVRLMMFALLGAGAGGALWFGFAASRPDPQHSAIRTEPTTDQPPRAVSTPSQEQAHAHEDEHGHQHGHPAAEALAQQWPAEQRVDPFAGRFVPPQLHDAEFFNPVRTELRSESACQQQPELARTDASSDAQSQLQALYGIDPHERYPREYFFRTLTQFWSLDGEHYQASAVWDIGMPPVYRLELHVSPVADFSREVLAVPPPITPPNRADALAAGAWIAQLSALYQRQGALLGQRIVEAQVHAGTAADSGSADLVLVDAAVRRWTFAGGHCEADRSAAALVCRCVDADHGQSHAHADPH